MRLIQKFRSTALVAALASMLTIAHAQLGDVAREPVPTPIAFPTKPIKILVGVTPGGTTDTLARFLAQEMSKELGQSVIVENKAGAGGNIAAEAVSKAAPDGYTLLFCNTSHSVNYGLYGDKLKFHPVDDFTPISLTAMGPAILIAHPSFPANTVQELIDMAKEKPGKFNFAIGGSGTSIHMAGELFKQLAGVDIVNVPYKGSAPALADVMGGQVQLMFAPVINAVPQIKAGKVKALGVTGTKAIPALPDVAPIIDTLKGYESVAYFGLLGPAKLPIDILQKLNTIAAKAAKSPELAKRLEPDGARAVGSRPDGFYSFIKHDIYKWQKVVKATGATPE